MMLSQKAYAAKNHVAPSSVKRWYDKNYLPGAKRNDCTGVYEIPDDTPVPYHKKGLDNVTNLPTLMIELLEAAESANSVFASMFPNISEDKYQSVLDGLVEEKLINLVETEFGVYLQITHNGVVAKGQLISAPKKTKSWLNTVLTTATSSVLATLLTKLITNLLTNPEWQQQLAQWFLPK